MIQRVWLKIFVVLAVSLFFVAFLSGSVSAFGSADFQINDFTGGSTANIGVSVDYQIANDATNQRWVYTAPTATLAGTPSDPTIQTTAAITVGGNDVTQYIYRLDSGSLSTATSIAVTLNLSGLSTGSHTLEVFGGDAPGNFQTAATTFTWTVNLTGGGGGAGSGVSLNQASTLYPYLAAPTANPFEHFVFSSVVELFGERPLDAQLYVNNNADGVILPTVNTWRSRRLINLGLNTFYVFARQNNVSSDTVITQVTRCLIGDTNCNGSVDDFDLAGLGAHWLTDWRPGDFNEDLIVDDFDLAGLAAYWTG